MLMPAPMVLHDQGSHVLLHFNCVDLTNVVLPLTTLLTPCDVSTGANGISDQISHVALHLNCC